MREGAYATHLARVSATEAKVEKAIREMRKNGVRIKISKVAAEVGMSGEHLSRRYSHVFSSKS
jgi:transcriptional regulator GlxA family with amidase domain